MHLEELVGRKLVIGIPGTEITPEIVSHFKETHAGGLILYRINFESPQQIRKLISDLENALGRKLLICADHEGGRVVMFRDGITVFPDSLAFGKTGKTEYARLQGKIEAKELRRLGIDVNLAPVLDVLTSAYSPNIGIRSYGRDWKLVSEMGTERIQAMQENGLSACAKHFPGKGHSPVDAHLGLPTIRSSWKEMEEVHLKPFEAAIEAGIDVIMSSHPYYPNLDPEPNRIATFSRGIIHDYLRKKMGFEGVIASDDLEMGAIREICSVGEASVRAAHAGHDLLLVCHDMKLQKEAFAALLEAYKDGTLSKKELEESATRIGALKAKRQKRFETGAPRPDPAGKKLAEKVCAESAAFLDEKQAGLKAGDLKKKSILVIFPQFSSLAQKIMIEKAPAAEAAFIAKEFGRFRLKPRTLVVPIEPSEDEVAGAVALAREADHTILFCFDAHLYPSNKKLLDNIQIFAKNASVVLLRDPYDSEFVRGDVPCVTDFGWRACQIRASIAKLLS